MDEQKTNESMAEAMGMTVEEVAAEMGAPEAEVVEASEELEDDQAAEDAPVEDEPEDHSEEETTSEEAETGDTLSYGELNETKAWLAADGMTEARIESLDPDELLTLRAKRIERNEAFDGMKRDLKRQKSTDGGSDDKATDEGAPTTEPDNTLSQADLSKLAEEFGDDEAKQIAGYVNQAVTAQVEAAQAPLLAALDQMIDAQQQSRLAGMVPDGLSGEQYEAVRNQAVVLANAGQYAEMTGPARQNALFDAALHLEFPDLPSAAEIERTTKRAAQKRNGSPSRSGRAARKSTAMTVDEKMDARLRAAVDGKNSDQIRAMGL